ncbi:hypothetical protein PoB_007361300 [Plakobranchus ocellatus]|uniref:Uncharacterized protein n=1 Tax=Plakobranchus ocellatus TaxID=259542 RepID=A0AAV4DSQ1_9GAST|nr:hypothetical protein PoB_007361300 [Plakobranchus ocellatus]
MSAPVRWSQLALSGFSRGMGRELDNLDGKRNEGFAKRGKWNGGSKECDMGCRVNADIFHQEKLLKLRFMLFKKLLCSVTTRRTFRLQNYTYTS